eukprot:TRINITY_DN4500_c0_g1_i2.p2 TRINITY_DN4500_c0_g1~~TRINITY_DN4500_c0_g1_i2.p2  ORF type:complete len:293 (+),score=49.51 TRINITY_DN4500_c0_g1_i2:101-979(+)
MIRRPPRSTQGVSSAASDVYKRQVSTQSTWERDRQYTGLLSQSKTVEAKSIPENPTLHQESEPIPDSFHPMMVEYPIPETLFVKPKASPKPFTEAASKEYSRMLSNFKSGSPHSLRDPPTQNELPKEKIESENTNSGKYESLFERIQKMNVGYQKPSSKFCELVEPQTKDSRLASDPVQPKKGAGSLSYRYIPPGKNNLSTKWENRNRGDMFERQMAWAKAKENKLKLLQDENKKKETQGCTFRPLRVTESSALARPYEDAVAQRNIALLNSANFERFSDSPIELSEADSSK